MPRKKKSNHAIGGTLLERALALPTRKPATPKVNVEALELAIAVLEERVSINAASRVLGLSFTSTTNWIVRQLQDALKAGANLLPPSVTEGPERDYEATVRKYGRGSAARRLINGEASA